MYGWASIIAIVLNYAIGTGMFNISHLLAKNFIVNLIFMIIIIFMSTCLCCYMNEVLEKTFKFIKRNKDNEDV